MFGLFEKRSVDTSLCPIGIDMGSAEVKLVQARQGDSGRPDDVQVLAAASIAMPTAAWRDAGTMTQFFRDEVRMAVARGGFRGRRAVVALPAAHTYCTRLRCQSMDRDALARATARAGCDWMPFPPEAAAMRHLSAGDVYDRESVHQEVITMAVHRGVVRRCLDAIEAAKLDVASVTPEPLALLETVTDGTATDQRSRLLVDLGHAAVRAYVIRGGRLKFARSIPVKPLAVDAPAAAGKIAAELEMCRKYFESTFATSPVTELLFAGGGTRDRSLCTAIASALNLPARAHNPLARLSKPSAVAAARGAEAQLAACKYAVALGLSLAGANRRAAATAGADRFDAVAA